MFVTKEFTFDSAHFLPHYHGKCEKMHGHTYRIQVTVEADVNAEDGLAYDFSKIKEIVKRKIVKPLDHQLLNDIIDIPSAENMAVWCWERLKRVLPLFEIKIWETPTSFITYRGG